MTSITQTAQIDLNNDGRIDTITFTLSEVGKNVRTLHAKADLGGGVIRDLGTANVPPQGAYSALSFNGGNGESNGTFTVDADPETGVKVHYNSSIVHYENDMGEVVYQGFFADWGKLGWNEVVTPIHAEVPVITQQ